MNFTPTDVRFQLIASPVGGAQHIEVVHQTRLAVVCMDGAPGNDPEPLHAFD